MAQFQADLEADLIKKSASHPLGNGMEKGGLLHCARKARASLIREQNFAAAKALDYIVAGALCEPTTDPENGPTPEQLCQRCGAHKVDTKFHAYGNVLTIMPSKIPSLLNETG